MELVGEQRIAAAQPEVWRALNDPDVLKKCIPGCESIERVSDDEFKIVMLAAVGPVKARFNGALAIRNALAPTSYDLVFEGSGGVAGFGKGTASVSLAPEDAMTMLRYEARAQVGGRLAQVGSRLIDGVAKKMAIDFFGRFNGHFCEAGAVGAGAASVRAAAPVATSPASLSSSSAGVISALPGAAALVTPLRIIAVSAVIGAMALVGILFKLMSM
jgi:carbon monoxide dehydrogenase subunit G